jgi:hypothetical protein
MDTTDTTTNVLATICEGKEISDSRRASLARAVELGADQATLVRLVDAIRLNKGPTIALPAHRYEGLSRGRGWCRQGRGANAVWGERTDSGYRVGPGRWVVGGCDGFSRKKEDHWHVEHVQVGPETWTIAE